MTLLEAIILGIVEGITEYLPVSSTGHLILASSLMGLSERVDKDSLDAFEIVIQGGAILAVLGLYRERVWQALLGVVGRDPAGLRLTINVLAAFLPAAIIGVLLADTIKRHLFHPGPVLLALAAGGIAMIAIDRWQGARLLRASASPGNTRRVVDLDTLTMRQAVVIGLLQCLAMWPGTSRSMVTIVGAMLVGMRPRQAAEFSFILGLPTLGGACVFSLAKNLAGDGVNMLDAMGLAPLLVGIVVATISAALAVRWLVTFLTRHGLAVFGWYRLALCAVLAVLIWQGVVTISPEPAPRLARMSFAPTGIGALGPEPSVTASSGSRADVKVGIRASGVSRLNGQWVPQGCDKTYFRGRSGSATTEAWCSRRAASSRCTTAGSDAARSTTSKRSASRS